MFPVPRASTRREVMKLPVELVERRLGLLWYLPPAQPELHRQPQHHLVRRLSHREAGVRSKLAARARHERISRGRGERGPRHLQVRLEAGLELADQRKNRAEIGFFHREVGRCPWGGWFVIFVAPPLGRGGVRAGALASSSGPLRCRAVVVAPLSVALADVSRQVGLFFKRRPATVDTFGKQVEVEKGKPVARRGRKARGLN